MKNCTPCTACSSVSSRLVSSLVDAERPVNVRVFVLANTCDVSAFPDAARNGVLK
jgi:hypothetical protein